MSTSGAKRDRYGEPTTASSAPAVSAASAASAAASGATTPTVVLPDIGSAAQATLARWRATKIPNKYGIRNKSLAEDLAGPHRTKTEQRSVESSVRASVKSARQVQKETGRTLLHLLPTSFFDEVCVERAVVHIEAGADIHARDAEGNTPLHFAAAQGCLQYATLLMELGADPTVANDREHCAMEMTPMGAKGAGFVELWNMAPLAAGGGAAAAPGTSKPSVAEA